MPQTYLLQRTFADVDDLTTEARRWNVDFRQLDRGAFAGELLQFGVGPKEYLKVFRLISVRRQLRAASARTTRVTDVANGLGFWHMGQFAADYRQRFGELPSETLQR
jgi:transcriptional regulator GlxA family with amidase domain